MMKTGGWKNLILLKVLKYLFKGLLIGLGLILLVCVYFFVLPIGVYFLGVQNNDKLVIKQSENQKSRLKKVA